MVKDTRKLKCLFGMHQWQIIEKRERHFFSDEESKIPTRICVVLRMQCSHCGKWESQIID